VSFIFIPNTSCFPELFQEMPDCEFAGRISPGKVPSELSLSEDYRFRCKICLSQETHLSRTTVRRIMHRDLHLFSYKILILQAQTAANKEERRTFCANICQLIEDHPTLLDLIFFSDVAHLISLLWQTSCRFFWWSLQSSSQSLNIVGCPCRSWPTTVSFYVLISKLCDGLDFTHMWKAVWITSFH
jgi:hypothetical protein